MQEIAPAPTRTPEQEATFQTQKITGELNLSERQAEAIYEINLRHARERQISNSRADALERSKNKNEAMQKVLTPEQYKMLQERRVNRNPSATSTQRGQPDRTIPVTQRRTTPANRDQRPYRR